ncbi:MAG TPA: hypothetical protein VMM55_05250 [Thermohalobaculum sp.]|nr:hypothetical protein [Thermohalobaculum sp.]
MEDMRTGATVSGGLHALLIALALFGTPFMSSSAPAPLTVTEVEFIDGATFDARLSTAPIVPNEGPAEMAPPQPKPEPELSVDAPDAELARAESPPMTDASAPPEAAPDEPDIVMPAPPVEVPTEAPRLSIAEIPSPDALDRQSTEPESPAATEPMQALATAPSPMAAPALPPPPEPEPVVAEAEPEPEPEEIEVEPEPEPESVEQAQPEAPISRAPQQARLPVAKPAEIAAAAQASSRPDRAAEPEPEPEEAEDEPEPDPPAPQIAETPEAAPEEPTPAAGSTSQFAAQVTQGEKDSLRLAIKQYFNPTVDDPTLQVTLAVRLNEQGRIVDGPDELRASGGNPATQQALLREGRKALIYAANGGEFAKLPRDKHAAWEVLHVTFTTDRDNIGVGT